MSAPEQQGWQQPESRRYRKIADEKIKEFDGVVQQNTRWLGEYVETILGGTPEQTTLASLLKTPAATRRPPKPVDAHTAAAERPADTLPHQTALDDQMAKIREKIYARSSVLAPSSAVGAAADAAVEKASATAASLISNKRASPNTHNLDSPAKKLKTNASAALAKPPGEAVDETINMQQQRLKSIFTAGSERLRKALDSLKGQSLASLRPSTVSTIADTSYDTAMDTDTSFISQASSSIASTASRLSSWFLPPGLRLSGGSTSHATNEKDDEKEQDETFVEPSVADVTPPEDTFMDDVDIIEKQEPIVELIQQENNQLESILDEMETQTQNEDVDVIVEDDESKDLEPIQKEQISSNSIAPPSKPIPPAPQKKPELASKIPVMETKAKKDDNRLQSALQRRQEEEQRRQELLKKKQAEKMQRFETAQEQKRKEEELLKKKKLDKDKRVQQNLQDMKEKKEIKVTKPEAQYGSIKPRVPASGSQLPKAKTAPAATITLVPFSSSDATVKISQPTVTCTPAAKPGQSASVDPSPANESPQIDPTQTIVNNEGIIPNIQTDDDDSSDEEILRPKKPSSSIPLWAQTPALNKALQDQTTLNPDAIFGEIPTLRLEDIFKGNIKRFRPRTSSANWTHDKLTRNEVEAYARQMGFSRQ